MPTNRQNSPVNRQYTQFTALRYQNSHANRTDQPHSTRTTTYQRRCDAPPENVLCGSAGPFYVVLAHLALCALRRLVYTLASRPAPRLGAPRPAPRQGLRQSQTPRGNGAERNTMPSADARKAMLQAPGAPSSSMSPTHRSSNTVKGMCATARAVAATQSALLQESRELVTRSCPRAHRHLSLASSSSAASARAPGAQYTRGRRYRARGRGASGGGASGGGAARRVPLSLIHI
eukprot:2265718-Prymnesium_polylepis.1